MGADPSVDITMGQTETLFTQRAYTLSLRRAPGTCNTCNKDACNCWRDALWATHEAVNKGAKVFGDWLLTLRGGLCHTLAEPPPPAKGKSRTDEETAALRADRRILLALSWLSVEDAHGAPDGSRAGEAVRVATGQDTAEVRKDKVLKTLRVILTKRGLNTGEIDSWIADCADSLSSRIRDDAVWVNRSAMFDAKTKELKELTHKYATETVLSFFGPADDYFSLPDADAEDGVALAAGDDDSKFKQKARQWICTNFGTGKKSDTDQIIESLCKLAKADLGQYARRPKAELIKAMSRMVNGPTSESDLDRLRVGIGWSTGRPSKGRLAVENLPDYPTKTDIEAMQQKFAEEAADKKAKSGTRGVPTWMPGFQRIVEAEIRMPFVGSRNHIGEFSVMLDHAARRVSIGHSWIKRAEAQRRQFDADARKLDSVPAEAAQWLDGFIEQRGGAAGGDYRIRRRAIEGWDKVVERWSRTDCVNKDDRIKAARELQDDPEVEKFGDIQLFEALAGDDAKVVWHDADGKPDAQILKNYVLGHDARFRQRHYRVPAYRHPDPLRHPVFADFGNSRWQIAYAVHEVVKSAGSRRKPNATRAAFLQDHHSLNMTLWNGGVMKETRLQWSSKRLSKDLGLNPVDPGTEVAVVSRADRLGRAAAGVAAMIDTTPCRVASMN
jgi:hypothetical protein